MSTLLSGQEAQNSLTATGTLDTTLALTEITFADGRILQLPTAMLLGSASFEQPLGNELRADVDTVIPIVEERLTVGKRTLVTGKVRLIKTVQEFDAQLDEPLAVRTFDVERVILNQSVETAPGMRQEGETTIYPLVEEQLILTKQLVLKEEIRVTRRDTERRDTQVVTLRREHVEVEREAID